MILIADCGSTKIDWCVLNKTKVEKQVFTLGMNAVMLTEEEMRSRFSTELLPELGEISSKIKAIYFYGAGCISPEVCGNVARIESQYALMRHCGSIRRPTRRPSAFAVVSRVLPAYLAPVQTHAFTTAKVLPTMCRLWVISSATKAQERCWVNYSLAMCSKATPAEVCARFLNEYDLDLLGIIRRVYREPQANRFLASVTPFLSKNTAVPEIHDLVFNAFKAFFKRNIKNYEHYSCHKVNFIGSIAYYFRDILQEAATAEGCQVGRIVKSPMEGLIKFHSN